MLKTEMIEVLSRRMQKLTHEKESCLAEVRESLYQLKSDLDQLEFELNRENTFFGDYVVTPERAFTLKTKLSDFNKICEEIEFLTPLTAKVIK